MAAKYQTNQDVYKKYIEQVTVLYHNRQDVRMYAEILLSMSAIVIFGIFAIKPTVTTITGLYSEIKAKREIISLLNQKIENLVTAQSLLEQQRVRIATLNQAIPDEPLLEKQVRQIEGVAKRNGVDLIGIKIENVALLGAEVKKKSDDDAIAPPHPDAAFFPITVSVEGSYSTTHSFLRELENMRRPLSQNSTGVSQGKTGSSDALNLTVSGYMAYLKKDEQR